MLHISSILLSLSHNAALEEAYPYSSRVVAGRISLFIPSLNHTHTCIFTCLLVFILLHYNVLYLSIPSIHPSQQGNQQKKPTNPTPSPSPPPWPHSPWPSSWAPTASAPSVPRAATPSRTATRQCYQTRPTPTHAHTRTRIERSLSYLGVQPRTNGRPLWSRRRWRRCARRRRSGLSKGAFCWRRK